MTAPIRPKAPAAGVRPRAQSSHDHSVPEARRAREPMPDDATVPMRRSDHPPSMPPEDDWNAQDNTTTQGGSPRPAAVSTDANALRAALLEAIEPLQHALDDLTLKIARERVDRKEAIDKLERAVARVSTGNPPPVTPFAAAQMLAPIQSPFSQPPAQPPPKAAAQPAPAAAPGAPPQQKSTLLGMSPQGRAVASATETPLPVEQPYSVSPSAAPPPVGPVAAPAAAPVATAAAPVAKPASPAPPPVAIAVAARAPAVVAPSYPPVKIDFDYSTDLSFELPPGLDGSRRKRVLAWAVAVIVVGGAIAMIVSMLISRSRPAGSL